MAEALLAHAIEDRNQVMEVASRGLQVPMEAPANEKSIAEMNKRGLDLLNHRAISFTREECCEHTLVLTMTDFHMSYLKRTYPEFKEQIFTLKGYVGELGDVHDPYGGNDKIYGACADEIEGLIAKLIELLNE